MRIVNKYSININDIGDNGIIMSLPIGQTNSLVGKEDTIKRDFIEKEVKNSINEIIDYEKVKIKPNSNVKSITYNVKMFNDGYSQTTWSDIGFENNDIKYRRNNFIKSHLRLEFYDSDIVATQRLLFYVTLFPKYNTENIVGDNYNSADYTVSFTLSDNTNNRNLNSEGFNLYYFKDEILPTVPKHLYMKGVFNNAKNGKTTKLMSSDNPNLMIDNLILSTNELNINNNIHTRYLLIRDENGYRYEIDNSYSTNVVMTNDKIHINLHQISVQ